MEIWVNNTSIVAYIEDWIQRAMRILLKTNFLLSNLYLKMNGETVTLALSTYKKNYGLIQMLYLKFLLLLVQCAFEKKNFVVNQPPYKLDKLYTK